MKKLIACAIALCASATLCQTAQARAYRPVWSPDPGPVYQAPLEVTLSSITPNATIYYTLNGEIPNASSGFKYTKPIVIDSVTKIRTLAVAPGEEPSYSVSVTYNVKKELDREITEGITPTDGEIMTADVLVVGGSTGGVSAALSALKEGMTVIVTEDSDWLGGQFTSQGLNCSDENRFADSFGSSSSYKDLVTRMRTHYGLVDPGECWVSGFCAEPRTALYAIDSLLEPYVISGDLRVVYGATPVEAIVEENKVAGFKLALGDGSQKFEARAKMVIDSTDLGDAIKLAGAEYRVGQEARSDTGEADAPETAAPASIQAFTYIAVVERRPEGENHVIPKPAGYGVSPWMKGFSHKEYSTFEGETSVWSYRRIYTPRQEGDADLSVMNFGTGNDYYWGNIVDATPENMKLHLERAKARTLAYIYWLQTEADGTGHPNIMLRPDIFETPDGIAKKPYIREGRRLKAMQTIRVEDVTDFYIDGARARNWTDSTGIGLYNIDLHRASAPGTGIPRGRSLPFQIPLGALIPVSMDGLIAGGKAIGSTHMTNGAYRLHPIEWNVGEAAGKLAAMAIRQGVEPRDVWADKAGLLALQYKTVSEGSPIFWMDDFPSSAAGWKQAQLCATAEILGADPQTLNYNPYALIYESDFHQALNKVLSLAGLPRVEVHPPEPGKIATIAYVRELLWAGVGTKLTPSLLASTIIETRQLDKSEASRILGNILLLKFGLADAATLDSDEDGKVDSVDMCPLDKYNSVLSAENASCTVTQNGPQEGQKEHERNELDLDLPFGCFIDALKK